MALFKKQPHTCAATVVWSQNKWTTAQGMTGSSEDEATGLGGNSHRGARLDPCALFLRTEMHRNPILSA